MTADRSTASTGPASDATPLRPSRGSTSTGTDAADAFDAVVVGSGFGGAVASCRLAEAGMRVLVLERGREWSPETYPRDPTDPWVYDEQRPHKRNGWIDMRFYRGMAVVQGAGVGGGSLIYANVSVEAPAACFESGWPAQVTYEAMRPHYDEVGRMLNVQELPRTQATKRFQLMEEAAAAVGASGRFRPLPLAVTFDPEWTYDRADARTPGRSREWTNGQGVRQGTCIHCGECDVGCPVRAKNTLDLNYLAQARRHGAEVRPLHLVRRVEPEGEGYRVHFDRVEDGRLLPGSVWGRRVLLAAGSLGSTELLLRCRDQHGTLPHVSRALGRDWSSNGDFLTPAFYADRSVSPTVGPTITAAIDFLDAPGQAGGQRLFIEDGGFPDLAGDYIRRKMGRFARKRRRYRRVARHLARDLGKTTDFDNVMPWFAQGVDAGDGRMRLGRVWYMPWRRALRLRWHVERSKPMFDALVATHERLAKATGGTAWVPPTWRFARDLVTPHPLGGCRMADSPAEGVVDHRGEVFGHPGLYVVDGAIIPVPIGRNPSRTIAALAERIARLIVEEAGLRTEERTETARRKVPA